MREADSKKIHPSAFSAEETVLLRLLRRALAGTDAGQGTAPETGKASGQCVAAAGGGLEAGDMPDWNRLLGIAERHAVLPLLYGELETVELPLDLRGVLEERSRMTVRQYYHLLILSRYYVSKLREAKIPSAVLKGVGASADYPVPELRKSGDIDLFVAGGERFEAAVRVLEACGCVRSDEQHSSHHIAFDGPDGIEVELHRGFAERFDDEEINRKMERLPERMMGPDAVRTREICGCGIPVLRASYQALALLFHMLHHFLRAGFGLKLLCDWTVFWNAGVAPEEREIYEREVAELKIQGFSEMVTSICVYELGLSEENMPGDLAGREMCERFLREIFEAEEFGETDGTRMVMLRGTSPADIIREFHHQTCLNYPRASKVFLTFPVLWILTFARFLRNNRKVRGGVSVRGVVQNARERSVHISELELFRR